MRRRFAEIMLWVAIVLSGIVFGASVYQRISIIPEWGGNLPSSVATYFQGTHAAAAIGRFWAHALPPTALVVLLTFAVGWPDRLRRPWLALALGLFLVAFIWTEAWFVPRGVIPLMVKAGNGMTPEEVTARASAWIFWDWFRMALTLGFLLSFLKALTQPQLKPAS